MSGEYFLQENDFMIKVDLKDAYFDILSARVQRILQCFTVKEICTN